MSKGINIKLLNAAEVGADWDTFVDRSAQPSVFAKSAWLRAVGGLAIKAVIVKDESGAILAGMPFLYLSSRLGIRRITMPPFTQTLGPILARGIEEREQQRISREVSHIGLIVKSLPDCSELKMTFHPNLKNGLPFLWQGCAIQAQYTYRFENLVDINNIRERYSNIRRREIKKAAQTHRIIEDIDAIDFYNHQRFARKSEGAALRYTWEQYSELERVAGKHIKKIAVATPDGRIVATVALAWDPHCCYYLLPAVNPADRRSGCVAFMIDHAIEWASRNCQVFDFEGSSTLGIEEYYRNFGAQLCAIYSVSKDSRGPLVRALTWSKRSLWRLLRT